MASKPKVRFSCRALRYLEPVRWPHVADLKSQIIASGSTSPVRSVLEKRSDLAFVDDIVGRLVGEGLDGEHARSAVLGVLCEPTVGVRRSADEAGFRVLQSVVFDSTRNSANVAVTVDLFDTGAKGGGFSVNDVTIELVSVDDLGDELQLVEKVERWRRDYPLPVVGTPPADLPKWAFAGNPVHRLREVPPGWETRIKLLGSAHGAVPDLALTPEDWKARSVGESSDYVLGLRGTEWVERLVGVDEGSVDSVLVGASGQVYQEVEDEIRGLLLRRARLETSVSVVRALEVDEVVYHRKIGKSPKFDRFDAGSEEPCKHGAAAFIPFKSADKATKGMARRYTNFSAAMLVHCEKYPNCGMYGVDQSRG